MYRECLTAEAGIGMRRYLCDTDGTGGHLKTEPEDFVVREISDPPRAKEGGEFSIATVTSRNWETNRLVRMLSRSLGMSRTRIGFAGTKDKRAVTTQLMSFRCPPEDLARVNLKDVTISDVYTGSRAIQLGDLIGNSFEVTVRDPDVGMDEAESLVAEDVATIESMGGFPNYFGVQRFGAIRPVTHLVGERLVRGDIEGAVRTYVCFTTPEEDPGLSEIRRSLEGCEDWAEAAKIMPDGMSFERTMAQTLAGGGDWRDAVASLPSNLQMMFVHAYQSYLFNEMLSERMSRGLPLDAPVEGDVVIPMAADGTPQHEEPVLTTARNMDLVARQVRMGRAFVTVALYGSEGVLAEGEPGEIERSMAEREGLEPGDFVIPGLPKCSSKGGRREVLCPVRDLGTSFSEDSYRVSFSLPKGNYATCLMREFMKSEMRDYRSQDHRPDRVGLVHAEVAVPDYLEHRRALGQAVGYRRQARVPPGRGEHGLVNIGDQLLRRVGLAEASGDEHPLQREQRAALEVRPVELDYDVVRAALHGVEVGAVGAHQARLRGLREIR